MKTLLNKWFLLGCFTWLFIQLARKLGHPIPYLNGYLSDAFAIPVIANLALWFSRIFLIKNDYYILSKNKLIFIVIYVSILFEGILPLISKKYTADWVDLLLYIVGGLFFYKFMNRPLYQIRK